jgi:hypothetical protein
VAPRRSLTIILQPDGALTSRTIRIPLWALRSLAILCAVVGTGFLLAAAFYLPIFAQRWGSGPGE